MSIGKIAGAIRSLTQGIKMMDSGSSEQETRSFLSSQGLTNINITKSTPEIHDVTVEGIKKKFNKGTNVSYSGIRTSSKGLLTDVKLEKKTLLGS